MLLMYIFLLIPSFKRWIYNLQIVSHYSNNKTVIVTLVTLVRKFCILLIDCLSYIRERMSAFNLKSRCCHFKPHHLSVLLLIFSYGTIYPILGYSIKSLHVNSTSGQRNLVSGNRVLDFKENNISPRSECKFHLLLNCILHFNFRLKWFEIPYINLKSSIIFSWK